MTIAVNGVEIEIQGAATVRVDGDKVIIEVGEREPAPLPWSSPYPDHGIDPTVPYRGSYRVYPTLYPLTTSGTVMIGRNDPMYKLWSFTNGDAPTS